MILKYYLENGNCFTYEANYDEVYGIIEEEFAKDYGLTKNKASRIIGDFELYEKCEAEYEKAIKDHFEERAFKEYEDNEKYPTDADRYGVKQSWFV